MATMLLVAWKGRAEPGRPVRDSFWDESRVRATVAERGHHSQIQDVF